MDLKIKRLKDDEKVIFRFGQHWVYMLSPIFIMGFATVLFYAFGRVILHSEEMILKIVLMVVSLLTLITLFHWFFMSISFWLFSRVYITNERIIIFEILPFIHSDVTFINVDEIHEIEEHQNGIWPSLLNYGSVSINLPAVPVPINLHYVPNPSDVANIIEQIRYEHLRKR